jgi:hypothetical protein
MDFGRKDDVDMKRKNLSMQLTSVLLVLNAVFWLVFGLMTLFGMHPALPSSPGIKLLMAVLAILCSAALFALTLYARRSPLAYYSLVALLGLLALFTFLDDFGLADLAYLLLDLAGLALLVRGRKLFLRQAPESEIP